MRRLFVAGLLSLLAVSASAEPSKAITYALAYNLPLHLQVIPGGGTTFVGGSLTSATSIANDVAFSVGSAADTTVPGFIFATANTPDTGILFTGSLSNSWIIAEGSDKAFDFALAQQTDPTLCIQSHNQSTTQRSCFAHDGTNAVWWSGGTTWTLTDGGAVNKYWYWDTVNLVGRNNALIGFNSSGTSAVGNPDAFFRRGGAAAKIQMGSDANGAVTAQQFTGPNGITGTDIAGGAITFGGQVGTGAGAASSAGIGRAIMRATGTTAQVSADGIRVCESKTLSNTSATAQTVAIIDLASNSAAGAIANITVTCTDGTNFNSETVSSINSFVNKATVLTIGSAGGVTTATTAANNNGSCTIGQTWIAGTNQVLLKVTPVFTTIVPTTVTAYVEVITHQPSAVAVACQ